MCAAGQFRDIVSTVKKYPQTEQVDWDRGREGYLDLPQKPVYKSHKAKNPLSPFRPKSAWEV